MSKYNSMVDIVFSVNHDFENTDDLTDTENGRQMLLKALLKRYESLVQCPEGFEIVDTIVCEMDY